MGKPVIYFPFDSFEFMKRQYSKSIFDMEENGFGPVARNTEEIVKNLRESYRKSFQMERKYMMRMERFYPLHDAHNCERVWATIRKKERQWWEYAGKRSSNYL